MKKNYVKRAFLSFLPLTCLCVLMSCNSETTRDLSRSVTQNDPPGTIASGLLIGKDDFSHRHSTQQDYLLPISLGKDDNGNNITAYLDISENFNFLLRKSDTALDDSAYIVSTPNYIDNISKISFPNISHADSVWSDSVAVIAKHGYIIKKNMPDGDFVYTRLYVVGWMTTKTTSNKDSVIGAYIKYQPEWRE